MENNKKTTKNHLSPLIFVVGPTATGKSSVALSIAEKLGAPIINLDSLQIYKSVSIGTAMPTLEERKRVPHYLFDYVDEGVNYTAGQFRSDAIDVLDKIQGPIVLVGGSGFYIRALEKGMYSVKDIPKTIKDNIQNMFDTKGAGHCYELLKDQDPEYAKKISENDHYRVQRGLELIMSENKTMAEIQKKSQAQLETTKLKNPMMWLGLDVDRAELKIRVQKRFDQMCEQGLKQEVKALMDKDLYEWTPMKSVGFVETTSFLNGEITQDEWKQLVVKNTMYLAKRQRTWFKKDERIQWLTKNDNFIEMAEAFVQNGQSR
ncbi:MAG: tRNA (adenosine(37)-N6)-dimethylallyltransferase MiaA [Bdellovibrionales bacterium]|nr:tRNA (adenosine(37)-N6)-dimethylallyltransferase MiaA [Bdellovibrionales bacterium]